MSRQFLAFLITGGLAAAVNFGSRILYNQWVEFSAAVILAYLTGMITAFLLVRSFVFTKGSQSIQRSATFFVLVNVIAVLQAWGVSMLLAYYVLGWLGVTRFVPEIAHAIGLAVPMFSSYLGHKRWSFK
jgi:putative flippase GtrA